MAEKINVVIMTVTRDVNYISRRVEGNVKENMRRVKEALGWNCKWELLSGFSHVPLARSIMLQQAREKHPDADRYVFWDDDQIFIGPNGLERLVAHEADVVGTLVVSRRSIVRLQTSINPDSVPADPVRFDGPPTLWEIHPGGIDEDLPHRECTGFGLISFRPAVFDAVIKRFEMPLLNMNGNELYHVFGDVVALNEGKPTLHGEDFGFCIRAASAGARIFVEPSLIVGHLGEYFYTLLDLGHINGQVPTDFPPGFSAYKNGDAIGCKWIIEDKEAGWLDPANKPEA